MKTNKIKVVSVEYVESGTFVGGEEDCFNADINNHSNYLVIKDTDFRDIQNGANKYCKILHLLTNDESGDLEFIRHQVLKIVEGK